MAAFLNAIGESRDGVTRTRYTLVTTVSVCAMDDWLSVASGLVLLLVGGEILVRGAVAIARYAGLSELMIGLTLVGFLTSLPEMVVSLRAVAGGEPGLAFGNVVGSNIANLLLVLAAGGVVRPLVTPRVTVLRDGGVNVGAGVILAVAAHDGVFGRVDGALMLASLGGYLWASYQLERRQRQRFHVKEAKDLDTPQLSWTAAIAGTLAGLAALMIGADLLVEGAVSLARRAGVSEAVIGLSLVAVGTSLPELATSVVASARRHTDVAVGNAIGSCIFNSFGIVGVSAVLVSYPADPEVTGRDLGVMLAVSACILPLLAVPQRLGRGMSLAFLLAYGSYLAWLFVR